MHQTIESESHSDKQAQNSTIFSPPDNRPEQRTASSQNCTDIVSTTPRRQSNHLSPPQSPFSPSVRLTLPHNTAYYPCIPLRALKPHCLHQDIQKQRVQCRRPVGYHAARSDRIHRPEPAASNCSVEIQQQHCIHRHYLPHINTS